MAKSKKKRTKYVYFYGCGKKNTEGDGTMRNLLGGKGCNLAEMATVGLPVPPGFTVTTEACGYYSGHGHKFPPGMLEEVRIQLSTLEKRMGKKLGDDKNPLLVSVRSGAAVSMPGMMDTVLNLGLNDRSVHGFIEQAENPRAGWDCYRRFIDMFGSVVMGPSTGIEHEHFEHGLTRVKKKYKAAEDTDLTAAQLEEVVEAYKKVYRKHVRKPFPQDPFDQLKLSILAVFGSWDADRAVKYRQINKISGLAGTAVNICSMVYGNLGDTSGTGVAFTRDGSSGEAKPMGEYLINAQGEDVVAGIRTPKSIDDMPKEKSSVWRNAHKQLLDVMARLERHYKYPQDVEFTVEDGTLYMLQTRNAKRTGLAGVRWAVEMATGKSVVNGKPQRKLLSIRDALQTVTGSDLEQLLFPVFDIKAEQSASVLATGLPAGPGAASGTLVFTAEEAEALLSRDKNAQLILARHETSPEDVGGMWAARGILTTTGGMTSHAAVVARGWGKCCICGAGSISVDYKKRTLTVGRKTLKAGDWISLNGSVGKVYAGQLPTQSSPVIAGLVEGDKKARRSWVYTLYQTVSDWSEKYRTMGVRTNADTPNDSAVARAFGAEGIGLTRTEHMFFEGDRIWAIREFILADDVKGRQAAVKKLLPYQRKDFEGIFKAMDGYPVTIRLLDPPLHEFLPHDKAGQQEMARRLKVKASDVASRVQQLHEFNPMLGHRGCRLSITYPELCEMQTRAIIEAACNVAKKGVKPLPEIMVPLVGTKAELEYLAAIIHKVADEIISGRKARVKYLVGTMIEIPRAALTADEVAEAADFFSFGTNDLTQMAFGFSRDDIGAFLPDYLEKKVLPIDPFQSLDQTGVGQLVEMGVNKGRSTNPDLKCGICGEHGGDPESVAFCYRTGLNYVSCSPYRVPIARLAAAQAAIQS